MIIQKLAYTYAEAAAQCGYSLGVVEQAVSDGSLPARYATTQCVIRHEDLAAWVAQLPTKPTTATSPVNDDQWVPGGPGRRRTADQRQRTPRQAQAPRLRLPERASEWLTPEDVGHMLQLSPGTLSNWRSQRRGPEFKRIAGVVRYHSAVVEFWLKAQPSK